MYEIKIRPDRHLTTALFCIHALRYETITRSIWENYNVHMGYSIHTLHEMTKINFQFLNVILAPLEDRKCIPISNSQGKEATLINITLTNKNLNNWRVVIPAMPNCGEDKVICWYTAFTLQAFV